METTFLWLEITGKCQLQCTHCYNFSGPDGTTGSMTTDDWRRVIDDAGGAGVRSVQLIGGEPTLHLDLPDLIRHALGVGLRVEVYSNLVHITPALWEVFRLPGVSLATSFYTDDCQEHAEITGRDTLRQITANIERAVLDNIPIRAGIIHVLEGQRATQATALLERLGVMDVGEDRLRLLGRGGAGGVEELCGHCGDGRAAILPDGGVRPCIMARWMVAGNVNDRPLAEILAGEAMRDHVASIPPQVAVCNPQCKPSTGDGSDCAPAETETCGPSYCNPDLGGR